MDIYRTLHPKAEYTFSNAHGTLSRISHMSGHKASLNKFKKTEIMSSIFSDHSAMKLEINHKKKKMGKNTKTWRLDNSLLTNQWVIKGIKEEIKKYLETNENKFDIPKSMGCSKSSSKRKVHSNTDLTQETNEQQQNK